MTPLEKALDRLANGHYLKSIVVENAPDKQPTYRYRPDIITVTFVDDETFTFPECMIPDGLIQDVRIYHKLRNIYQREVITKLNDFLQDRFADYPVEPFIKYVEAPNVI